MKEASRAPSAEPCPVQPGSEWQARSTGRRVTVAEVRPSALFPGTTAVRLADGDGMYLPLFLDLFEPAPETATWVPVKREDEDRQTSKLVGTLCFVLHELSLCAHWPDVLAELSPYARERLEDVTERANAWPYLPGEVPDLNPAPAVSGDTPSSEEDTPNV